MPFWSQLRRKPMQNNESSHAPTLLLTLQTGYSTKRKTPKQYIDDNK